MSIAGPHLILKVHRLCWMLVIQAMDCWTSLVEVGIDEDDAPFVALALHVDGDGIWSNDAHMHVQNLVRVWTTVEVLEELGSREAFS